MRLRLGYQSEAAGNRPMTEYGPCGPLKGTPPIWGLVGAICYLGARAGALQLRSAQILKRKWFTGGCPGLTAEARQICGLMTSP